MDLLVRAAAACRKLCHALAGNRASLNRFQCWQCSHNVDSVGAALQDLLLRPRKANCTVDLLYFLGVSFHSPRPFRQASLDNGKSLLDLSELPASQGSFGQSSFETPRGNFSEISSCLLEGPSGKGTLRVCEGVCAEVIRVALWLPIR